jgi:hypothetical protein
MALHLPTAQRPYLHLLQMSDVWQFFCALYFHLCAVLGIGAAAWRSTSLLSAHVVFLALLFSAQVCMVVVGVSSKPALRFKRALSPLDLVVVGVSSKPALEQISVL